MDLKEAKIEGKVEQLEKLEKYEEALKIFAEIDLQEINKLSLYLTKVRILGRMGNFAEAFENINFVLDICPTYEDAYLEKADLYFAVGDYEKGKQCFEEWEKLVSVDMD